MPTIPETIAEKIAEKMIATLAAQRAAFTAELPVTGAIRKDRLQRVVALLVDHGMAFAKSISDDFGHRATQTTMMSDINGTLRSLKSTIKQIDAWMKPERRHLPLPLWLMGARAGVEYQPKGVVGIIGPWNFPLTLTLEPLNGAFAAGNRAMIKFSEFTPATGALLEQVVPNYFDSSELAVFTGGPDVGQAFAMLNFDHLMFTGSTGVGKHILHAAADNLVPVTLELGGKSPAIIGRSANLAQSTGRIAMAKTLNAGQVCLAPDYLLVPKEQEGAIIDGIRSSVTAMYPTMLDNPDYTSVLNAAHRDRLTALLADARDKGAEVTEINPANEDFAASNGTKMPLNIVRNVTTDMKVMQEEIFGPILPVMTYDRIETAIDYVNTHDHALALYYFGADSTEEGQVLSRTISGGVTVNDCVMHVAMETLPFGGIGPSGMGYYHGFDGFKTFSHGKSVFHQTRFNIAKLVGMMPPYGEKTQKTIERDFKI